MSIMENEFKNGHFNSLDQLVNEIAFNFSFNNEEEEIACTSTTTFLSSTSTASQKNESNILERKPYKFKGGGYLGLIEIIQLTYQQFQDVNLSTFYSSQKARRNDLKKLNLHWNNHQIHKDQTIDKWEAEMKRKLSKKDFQFQKKRKTTCYLDVLFNRNAYFYFNSKIICDLKQEKILSSTTTTNICNNDKEEKKSRPLSIDNVNVTRRKTEDKDCVSFDNNDNNDNNDDNNIEIEENDNVAIDNDDNTGNRVYLGAILINLLLSYFPSLVQGKTVIELGCGVGLTGIALCRLGCRKIVLTDAQWNCLALAKYNISYELELQYANKKADQMQESLTVPPLSSLSASSICYHTSTSTPTSTFPFPEVIINQLRWGDDTMIQNILLENSIDCDGFDVIFGGDLLYYNVDVKLLFETIKKLLIPHETRKEIENNQIKTKPFIIVLAHLERYVGASHQFCQLCQESTIFVKELNIEHLIQYKEDEIMASNWRNGQVLICGNLLSVLPESLLSLCKDVTATLTEIETEEDSNQIGGLLKNGGKHGSEDKSSAVDEGEDDALFMLQNMSTVL